MKSGKTPLISFVGRSKTGKTTLIERLIPVLNGRSIRVAVIKHHHRDFEIDIPGKDTHRLKKSGARTVIISSPGKIALVQDTERDLTINEIISKYEIDADIIFIEGYKKAELSKIEVYQTKNEDQPVCLDDKNLLAIVADQPFFSRVPVFLRDDIKDIAEFILSHFAFPVLH